MNINQPCYLFLDYDGTVANRDTIARETEEALLRVKREGHFLILCTGRSSGLLKIARACSVIPWDGYILGGADLMWKNEWLRRRWISKRDVLRISNYAIRQGYSFSLEGHETCESYKFREIGREVTRELAAQYREKVRAMMEREHVTKISLHEFEQPMRDVKATILIHPGAFTEYAPAGCGKGEAILAFCRKLKIPLEQCIGFGDSLNDLSMFETLETCVSMAHAPMRLKEAASYRAKSAYGVAEGIRYYFGEEEG